MTPTPEQNAKRATPRTDVLASEIREWITPDGPRVVTIEDAVKLVLHARTLETELTELRQAADGMRDALIGIALKQPAILDIIQRNGFVFTDIGREPGNWQHLAFTIYTSLCEVDQTTKAALEAYRAAGEGAPKDTGTSRE